MKGEDLSLRTAASQIGIAHTTLARILRGETTDIGTLQLTCEWLGIPLSTILDVMGDTGDTAENNFNRLRLMVEAHPELAELLGELTKRYEAGNIDDVALQEIVNYATWRLKEPIGEKHT